MNESAIVTATSSSNKSTLAVFNQLFPSRTPKTVLKVGDTFIVPVTKQLPIYRVVGNSERSPLIPICYNDRFHGIGDQRDAASFQESKQNHVVRPSVYSQNGIQRAIEWFHPLGDRTTESATAFQNHTEVFPFVNPVNGINVIMMTV